jgi:DNA-binding PadR family transcriptional regulator
MPAKHALLGLLLDREAYPYQLADRLQRRLGPSWEVNSGQLYQTVKALERDGLIERVRGSTGEREDRHVFAITPEGVREFERWFAEAPDPVRLPRRPLLLKITLAGPQRLAEALAKVGDYERECACRLREIAALRDELPADGPLVRVEELLLRLNLSTDVFQLEGELRWAAHARELLEWLDGGEAQWPAQRERADAGEVPGVQEQAGSPARHRLFERMAGAGATTDTATDAPKG